MNASLLKRSLFDPILPAALRPTPVKLTSAAERRGSPRQQAALTAEVIAAGRSYVGQVRNISTTGLTLGFETRPPLFQGGQLLVRTKAFEPITGVVRWVGALECGMAFNSALAEDVLKDADALFDPGKRVRPGRAKIKLPAVVRAPNLQRKVIIENIASGGAQLSTGLPLAVGLGLMIEIDDLLPIGAYVRWSKGGRCGVMFSKLLPLTAAEDISKRCGIHSSWLHEIRQAHATFTAV